MQEGHKTNPKIITQREISKREISNVEAVRDIEKGRISRERREQWSDGREFERHVFGKKSIASQPGYEDYLKREKEILGDSAGPGKAVPAHKLERLIEEYKKFYNGDPLRPESDCARKVRSHLEKILELETDEQKKKLRFYNSLGSFGLDVKRGWDGFAEYDDRDGTVRIGFDATIDPESDRKKYSDPYLVVISPENAPDLKKEPEEYDKEMEKIAERAAINLFHQKEEARRKEWRPRGSLSTIGKGRRIEEYTPEKKPEKRMRASG